MLGRRKIYKTCNRENKQGSVHYKMKRNHKLSAPAIPSELAMRSLA